MAERVLLPGDPGRALRLAQLLIDGPKMLNHHRGLWGYSGPAKSDGAALTVQGAGLGGPSAAAVVADLAALGARRVIRVGTCAGGTPGELLVGDPVLATDGTSRALGPADPDPELTAALAAHAPRGALRSADVAAGADDEPRDLASAAVLAAARRHGLAAAVIVLARDGLSDEALHAAEGRMAAAAMAALS